MEDNDAWEIGSKEHEPSEHCHLLPSDFPSWGRKTQEELSRFFLWGDGAVSVGRLRHLESTVLSIIKKTAAQRESSRHLADSFSVCSWILLTHASRLLWDYTLHWKNHIMEVLGVTVPAKHSCESGTNACFVCVCVCVSGSVGSYCLRSHGL